MLMVLGEEVNTRVCTRLWH